MKNSGENNNDMISGWCQSRKIGLYGGNPGLNRHWATWKLSYCIVSNGVLSIGLTESISTHSQYSLRNAVARVHHYSAENNCLVINCKAIETEMDVEVMLQYDSKDICTQWLKIIEININNMNLEHKIHTDKALQALSDFLKERLYLQSRVGSSDINMNFDEYQIMNNNLSTNGKREIFFDSTLDMDSQIWKANDFHQRYVDETKQISDVLYTTTTSAIAAPFQPSLSHHNTLLNDNNDLKKIEGNSNNNKRSVMNDVSDDFVLVDDDDIGSDPSSTEIQNMKNVSNKHKSTGYLNSSSITSSVTSYIGRFYSSYSSQPSNSGRNYNNKIKVSTDKHKKETTNQLVKNKNIHVNKNYSEYHRTTSSDKDKVKLPPKSYVPSVSSDKNTNKPGKLVSGNFHSNVMIRTFFNNVRDQKVVASGDSSVLWSIPIPKLRILIMAVGTRGDVQPFALLGQKLIADGHRVRLATHACFRDYVQSFGDGKLEFYPLAGDPVKLSQFMVKTQGCIIPTSPDILKELPENITMLHEIIESCWGACIDPDPMDSVVGDKRPRKFIADAIISNPVTYAHIHCAEALGVPLHMMFPQPWVPTKAFPHPLACLSYANGWTPENYLSYQLVERMMWISLEPFINSFRVNRLGLQPIRMGEQGWNLLNTNKVPFVKMWSTFLVPKPKDWGPHIDVVGFFLESKKQLTVENSQNSHKTNEATINHDSTYKCSPELSLFLSSGPPPVFVGFGSMVIDDPAALIEILLEGAATANVRILVQSGWSDISQTQFLEMCKRIEMKLQQKNQTTNQHFTHTISAPQTLFDDLDDSDKIDDGNNNPWDFRASGLSQKELNASHIPKATDEFESAFALEFPVQNKAITSINNWSVADAMLIGPCPHDWLFPHMAAVVHHGGAGTTAAGLQAGKPTMICPFFGDQFFWGQMVHKAKVGPMPCPVTHLNVEIVANSFAFLFSNEAKTEALKMSQKFTSEDGVEGALNSFYKHLKIENMLCDISIFFGESRLAQVWCSECGFKMTREVADLIHESGLCNDIIPNINSHILRPCTYVNWGVKGPLSTADGIVQGLGGVGHEVAAGLVDAVIEPVRAIYNDGVKGAVGGIVSGLRHLVVRPMQGGVIFYHKVKEGLTNDVQRENSDGSQHEFTRDGSMFRPEDSGIFSMDQMTMSANNVFDDAPIFEPYSSDSDDGSPVDDTPEDVKELALLVDSEVPSAFGMSTSIQYPPDFDSKPEESKNVESDYMSSSVEMMSSNLFTQLRETNGTHLRGGQDVLMARSYCGDSWDRATDVRDTSKIDSFILSDETEIKPPQSVSSLSLSVDSHVDKVAVSVNAKQNGSTNKIQSESTRSIDSKAVVKDVTAKATSEALNLASRANEIAYGYRRAIQIQSIIKDIIGNSSRFISISDFSTILQHSFGDNTVEKHILVDMASKLVEALSRKKSFLDFVDFSLLILSIENKDLWKNMPMRVVGDDILLNTENTRATSTT